MKLRGVRAVSGEQCADCGVAMCWFGRCQFGFWNLDFGFSLLCGLLLSIVNYQFSIRESGSEDRKISICLPFSFFGVHYWLDIKH